MESTDEQTPVGVEEAIENNDNVNDLKEQEEEVVAIEEEEQDDIDESQWVEGIIQDWKHTYGFLESCTEPKEKYFVHANNISWAGERHKFMRKDSMPQRKLQVKKEQFMFKA